MFAPIREHLVGPPRVTSRTLLSFGQTRVLVLVEVGVEVVCSPSGMRTKFMNMTKESVAQIGLFVLLCGSK